MRDRGTLIAGAVIVLACVIAGGGFLYLRAKEAAEIREHQARVAHQAEANARVAQELQTRGNRRLEPTPKDAIATGASFLIAQQSEDGSWKSDTYASFKSGTALTPLVVCALQSTTLQNTSDLVMLPRIGLDPIEAGCDYLAGLVKPDGSIANADIDYPIYTAALTVVALSHPDQKRHLKARDAWLKFLLDRQLTESLGWKPADKQYGGWGYCPVLPKKPEPGAIAPPLVESNLSAPVFALEALKAAGVKDRDTFRKAEQFVKTCQNEDGGFFFVYDDPVRNKAGAAEGRFHSYGSATADGLRALRLCGGTEAKRIERASKWLQENFRADHHPGTYIATHEPNRDAVYFYYAASVAKTLRAEKHDKWRTALSGELIKRQNADGSWTNPLSLVREDDPIAATANALIALSNCTSE